MKHLAIAVLGARGLQFGIEYSGWVLFAGLIGIIGS